MMCAIYGVEATVERKCHHRALRCRLYQESMQSASRHSGGATSAASAVASEATPRELCLRMTYHMTSHSLCVTLDMRP